MTSSQMEIRPQPRQEMALASPADVVVYGGGAGGGKSWALLLESVRHQHNGLFNFTIFRRTSPMITNPGGLWQESFKLMPYLKAVPNKTDLTWNFPSKYQVKFAHLQHEWNVQDWQGAQLGGIGLDEATHFEESQFWYLFSRNRSMAGIRPYIRLTCNPDPESWVAGLISWWIGEDGYPIPERAGVLRWFVRINDVLTWADTREELAEAHPDLVELLGDNFAKSLTFIPARVQDNQKLLAVDPGYLGNLYALPLVDRERLLGGNWKIKLEAGKVFNRSWFRVEAQAPRQLDLVCSFWDLAATEKELKGSDPDYSARVLMGYERAEQQWWILDAFQTQAAPAEVEKLMDQFRATDKAVAAKHGARFMLRWEIEPGSAGKREAYRITTKFKGTDAAGVRDQRGKIERAKALSRQAEAGNVHVLQGSWNNEFLTHMHNQPDHGHDDLMDAGSGAFNQISKDADQAFSF
jgi:predicted phage terminase large subunit-like protein